MWNSQTLGPRMKWENRELRSPARHYGCAWAASALVLPIPAGGDQLSTLPGLLLVWMPLPPAWTRLEHRSQDWRAANAPSQPNHETMDGGPGTWALEVDEGGVNATCMWGGCLNSGGGAPGARVATGRAQSGAARSSSAWRCTRPLRETVPCAARCPPAQTASSRTSPSGCPSAAARTARPRSPAQSTRRSRFGASWHPPRMQGPAAATQET